MFGRRERKRSCRCGTRAWASPPEMLPRIFDLFTQAEQSLDRSEGELGIGLTVVKRLVEMPGGRVGSTVCWAGGADSWCACLCNRPRDVSPRHRPPRRRGRRFPRYRWWWSMTTWIRRTAPPCSSERLGHEVRVAYSGQDALRAVAEDRPDLVFLDLGLPELDGYEVARRLRQRPGLEDLVLVAMTGYGQESDRERSKTAGFDHHLVKPVDPSEAPGTLGHRLDEDGLMLSLIGLIRGLTTIRDKMGHSRSDPLAHFPQRPLFETGTWPFGDDSLGSPQLSDVLCPPATGRPSSTFVRRQPHAAKRSPCAGHNNSCLGTDRKSIEPRLGLAADLISQILGILCCIAPGVSILKDGGSSRRCSGCARAGREGRWRHGEPGKYDEYENATNELTLASHDIRRNEPKLAVRPTRNRRNEPKSSASVRYANRQQPSRGATRTVKRTKRSHDWEDWVRFPNMRKVGSMPCQANA